jgi:hypothetical protein
MAKLDKDICRMKSTHSKQRSILADKLIYISERGNIMAAGSLILGILALIVMLIPVIGFIAIPLAITGIILGAVSSKKLKAAGASTGVATGGIVTSIISLVLSSAFTIMCSVCAATGVAAGAGCLNLF